MPRVTFAAENKVVSTNYDYPKLRLKTGERARILVGLEDPLFEFVHTLNKPRMVEGKPVMETKERKDKTTYLAHKLDFVTKALCVGDATELARTGSDPRNCPMCKLAKDFPDYAKPPQRRYAMHVIRYRTKAGSTDVAHPFSVETLVWGFTDVVFNILADLKTTWGDLRKHDIFLGPCTSEDWQKFDINIAPDAAWLGNAEHKKLVVDTFKESMIPDLTIAVGSAKQPQWIKQDVETVLSAWAEVNAAKAGERAESGLDDDLNTLLSRPAKATAPAKAPAPAEVAEPITDDMVNLETGEILGEDPFADLDGLDSAPAAAVADDTSLDLFEGLDEPAAPVAAPAAKAVKKAAPVEAPPVDNFDDLLADI